MKSFLKLGVALIAVGPFTVSAQSLPQGGTVAQGSATIATPSAQEMTITQGSDRAIVNWNSFSIGTDARVDIQQPSRNAAILNRVTGSTTTSIRGQLNANGNVHIVNPNGIVIAPTGTINTGGFVASTLDISDGDFMSGNLTYQGNGSSASVENQGQVTISRDGYAAFLGGRVDNSGTVIVPYGKVGFASGERVTLDLSGDQFLQVALPSDVDGDEALITNSGTVEAEGGLIQMQAATARDAVRNAINLSGVAEASSVSVRGGTIILGGGDGGRVSVTGRARVATLPPMEASVRPPTRGGTVQITGADIALAGADIDASGDGGGGLIQIGGDFKGQGTLQRAFTLTADADTSIKADSLRQGDGGRIVLWSDVQTIAAPSISARGGDEGGDGGFIEVSSADVLNYVGLDADTRAPLGTWGTVLLDPSDFLIDASNVDTLVGLLDGSGSVTIDTATATPTELNPAVEGFGDVTIAVPLTWTTPSTLTIDAERDINVNAAVTGESGALNLNADRIIEVNAAVNTASLSLSAQGFGSEGDVIALNAPITTGALTIFARGDIGANAAVTATDFSLNLGRWTQIGGPETPLPAFSVSGNFDLEPVFVDPDSFNPGVLFIRAASGDGQSPDTPYALTDVFGLQGVETISDDQGLLFLTLANDIDASTTSNWSFDGPSVERTGFNPIDSFSGEFDGAGFTISNLTSQQSAGSFAEDGFVPDTALFHSNFGTIRDLTVSNATISGERVAVLAATNEGVIDNVSVSGQINSSGFEAGGLVAFNSEGASISNSLADVAVTATNVSDIAVGGLVGYNISDISSSRSTGNVVVAGLDSVEGRNDLEGTANVIVGGFVGEFDVGTIQDSEATGTVTVTNAYTGTAVGGFTGVSFNGVTTGSRATGNVTVTGEPGLDSNRFSVVVGGFIGEAASSTDISNSEATGVVTVNNASPGTQVGGFAGAYFGSATATASRATGNVSVTAVPDLSTEGLFPVFAGGFAGSLFGGFNTINDSVATGAVTITAPQGNAGAGAGGFVGSSVGSISRSHSTGAVRVENASSDFDATLVAGGFVALNAEEPDIAFGVASDSYALGDVTVINRGPAGVSVAGGFVGANTGLVERSFSAGAVNMTDDGVESSVDVGGFAGLVPSGEGVGASNYWDTQTSNQATSAGNAEGLVTADLQDTGGFVTRASGLGWDFDTVWAPGEDGFYPANYSTTPVVYAVPDAPTGLVYGSTSGVSTTGQVFGALQLSEDPTSLAPVYVFGPSGDVLNTSTIFDSVVFDSENAGDQSFTLGTTTLLSSNDVEYRVVDLPGTATIDPLALVIIPENQTKTYGEAFTFTGTEFRLAEGSSLVGDDQIISATFSSSATDALARANEGDEGGTPIFITDLNFPAADNYVFNLNDRVGDFTVLRADLTVVPQDQFKSEGEEFVLDTALIDVFGLVDGDELPEIFLTSDGTPAEAPLEGSPYDIAIIEFDDTALSNNYNIDIEQTGLLFVAPVPPENEGPETEEPNPGPNPGPTIPEIISEVVEIPIPTVFIGFPLPDIPDDVEGLISSVDGSAVAEVVANIDPVAIAAAQDAFEDVTDVTVQIEQQMASCETSGGDVGRYLACTSDALQDFADALDLIAADLPPGMQNVAQIVEDARVSIDAARTRAAVRLSTATTDAERRAIRDDAVNEARAALDTAATEIRKAISLVRADDPELASVQRATVTRVAVALDNVGVSLTRATSL